jgi:hypothetical protein
MDARTHPFAPNAKEWVTETIDAPEALEGYVKPDSRMKGGPPAGRQLPYRRRGC